MVNWEFFDNQTPESARTWSTRSRSGDEVTPISGAPLCTFRETARILAGFEDSRAEATEAQTSGAASLAGLESSAAQSTDNPSSGEGK